MGLTDAEKLRRAVDDSEFAGDVGPLLAAEVRRLRAEIDRLRVEVAGLRRRDAIMAGRLDGQGI